MFNQKESDEREYLGEVQRKLKTALEHMKETIDHYSREILETKRYIYENQLDLAEKAANRIAVHDSVTFGEKAIKERGKLQKLIQSPYFGRIDFAETKEGKGDPFYIGVHAFADPATSHNIIFDWRAPISSMFYDFEIGPAFYVAPVGKIDGVLTLKRQYRIRQTQMEYMIESSLNIGDEILQKELSQNSDDKMKNIVATIQREQNAIIRNDSAKVLILQGAAGSGKTSIALHRVAFLLYRYKETLTSKDLLIISPNKVFGNYISNVLPELGEENMAEISFDDIATSMLGKYHYQSFSEQVESLLADEDAEAIARIEFKATNLFVEQLQSYLEYADENYFVPTDLALGSFFVSKETLLSNYHALKRLPMKKRLRKIADDLIEKYKRHTNKKMDAAISRQIRDSIQKMFQFTDTLLLYQNFYRYLGRDDLFRFIRKNTLEFCDVYPFIYVKMYFEGEEQDYKSIQHLLVDEMQDYTPIQYAVLAKLFSCKMTILGDSYQSVNPYSSSSAEKIQPYFAGCDCMELCRSYRSTIEITGFTQKILENKKLIPIERHGDKPTITVCQTQKEQLGKIRHLIEQFRQSAQASLGIICKSQKQARLLFEQLHTAYDTMILLSFGSSEFQDGIVITSVHMSKGLEFDQVIVPDVSDDLYKTQLDRSLLYIACTRAMHKLDLTCCGKKTKFLN
ncbi:MULTISPECIES: UvrD-helicase domain-containing protein [Desulfitobacterium]|uniref:DNA/RNA helicase, superfamily I n=1 Tax=Desulfitobacterium dehalogenans (strain ATCC 51507 / DSM 9161 / JW/IU-DC1) TaxID=756499 RepID=I4ACG7_DESDJ|nr:MULTISPECIES: UvrD-helicase domain-containing protein [Desulfitobacterium]AFM01652.1 DNA/RNA helicase, superfamily I [Desulfitobacterium dehalogenans ATCC 51507]